MNCHAVLRFARATGDLHSLSTADIRLIALAHTLQLARHRDVALKTLPEVPSVRKGNAPAAKELPGWNETGDKWADLDKLTEEDLAEQELAGIVLTLFLEDACAVFRLGQYVSAGHFMHAAYCLLASFRVACFGI